MTSNAKTTVKHFLGKKWLRVSGIFFLILILALFLVPIGVKYYLADWLVKSGADSASIEKLRLNPFMGKMILGGVQVERGGKSLMQQADLVVDLKLSALFKKNIRLEKVKYNDLMIDLEQYEDGRWRFGSYTTTGVVDDGGADKVQNEAGTAWGVVADQVVLENCTVHLKTPALDMLFVIEDAKLMKFTSRDSESAGSLNLTGSINGDPIALNLDSVQVAPYLRIGGDIDISRFRLEEIAILLQESLPTFTGDIGVDGKALFTMDKSAMTLEYQGMINVLNPDIGSQLFETAASELKWQGAISYESPENSPMVVSTDGVLAATDYSLTVAGSDFVTKESFIELGGKTQLVIAENVQVENEGSLLIEKGDLKLPQLTLIEENLAWKGKVVYDSNHGGEGQFVKSDGILELAPFAYNSGEGEAAIAAGLGSLGWQGNITYGQKDDGKNSTVNIEGILKGGELYADLAGAGLKFSQNKLEVNSKTTLILGEKTDISGIISFKLDNFVLNEAASDSPLVTLSGLEVAELEGGGGKNVAVKELLADGLVATLQGDFPLDINVPNIKLAGFATEDLINLKVAELQLQKPRIVALHNNKELLNLDIIRVGEIGVEEGGGVVAATVALQNFIFLGVEKRDEEKAGLSLGKAQFSDISWSAVNGFTGDSLEFEDLVATVIRDKDGNINISQRIAAMQVGGGVVETATPEATAEKTETTGTTELADENPAKQQGMPLKLGSIVVAGDSNLNFEDYTLAVPYKTDLAITEFKISELDSSKPDQQTMVLFKGELEKRAPVVLTGNISPFKEKLAMDMKLKLKNYPLSSLSAYTVQSVGTALASGQLKLKTKLKLEEDELDMENNVLLKKLETETISKELAAELNNQLPIPLDAALSILRDSDRNIDLDIPLEGPVSDLNVGISDVLITALSKAIVPAASGYLMYTLGPYGALAYVGMKVGEKMLKVTLPPVEFVPGESTLTAEHKEYLQRIGKILTDRPETDIQLCPKVASWELMTKEGRAAVKGKDVVVADEDRQKLLALGQDRAAVVKEHLAQEYSIELDRLLICDTLLETEESAVPVVLLQL